MQKNRTVILGGGFGGVVTVRKMLKRGYSGEIVLVDKGDTHIYTPWLYEVASGMLLEKKPARFAVLRKVCGIEFKKLVELYQSSNFRFRQAKVIGCDFKTQHVKLEGGKTLKYDNLIIALGGEASYYGIPGLKENTFTMNSGDKVSRIQKKINSLITDLNSKKREQIKIVVCGGGATGCELSAELANCLNKCAIRGEIVRNQIRVLLIEAGDVVLRPTSKNMQMRSLARLKKIGVEVHLNTMITRANKDHIKVVNAKDKTKEDKITGDIIIWAGGVQPKKVLEKFDLPKDPRGRIKVDETLRVEGFENVFSIGDNTALVDPASKRAIPSLAQVAMKEAELLAKNIIRYENDDQLQKFKFPRRWITIIPMGGHFAFINSGNLVIGGLVGHYLRSIVDLKYFLSITPFWFAVKKWFKSERTMSIND